MRDKNDLFIQLRGPFLKGENVIDRIDRNEDFSSPIPIERLGIQSLYGKFCSIDGKIFMIGKTDILEVNDVRIKSLVFLQDEPSTTLVDCQLFFER